jgi:CRISPR system Cascade subunit CasA
MLEFNLIDEPWIPCIDLQGQTVEHGIRNTLLKAHELREICEDSPLATVAIHRLLFAILYRAFNGSFGTARWKALYKKGRFDPSDGIDTYLSDWRSRFNLFDNKYPFMQVAGLDLNDYNEDGTVKEDKSDGLMRLVREAPDKKGRILFDHRVGTERPRYEPKQIARMLLSAQSYAGTGVAFGGKLGGKSIQPTPCQIAACAKGLLLWLQGKNLFETLMLNLVPLDYVANDKPAWEDGSITDSAIKSWNKPNSFTGPVQRFAPLSRFIRIIDQQSMFFTNGLKTGDDSEDPMKAYSRQDDKEAFKAVDLAPDRAAWRDAHALFSLGSPARKPPASLNHVARLVGDGIFAMEPQPRANLVGLASHKGKALLWRHERMPVPTALLADGNLIERLGGLLKDAELTATELSSRVRRIAKLYLSPEAESPDGRQPDKDEVAKVVKAIDPRPAYWARLENHFFSLLENLPKDWDDTKKEWKPGDQQAATRAWRGCVKHEAQRALEESIRSLGATARTIQAVARVRTDFNDGDLKPKPQNVAKAQEKKKGGRKKT